jgi:hypothetical protein
VKSIFDLRASRDKLWYPVGDIAGSESCSFDYSSDVSYIRLIM